MTDKYEVREGYLYTKDHEWIIPKGSRFLVGITDYASKMLNDIVFVNMPEKGTELKRGDVFGQVESVKTVSDLYIPVTGKVFETNSELLQAPELVSKDPYADGWMLEIDSPSYLQESSSLLNAKAYAEFISQLQE